MMRSRLGRAFSTVRCSRPALPLAGRVLEAAASAERAIAVLATVPPCNDGAEYDVQTAKSGHQKGSAPGRRREQTKRARKHETEAHHRNDADRKSAAGNDCGAI